MSTVRGGALREYAPAADDTDDRGYPPTTDDFPFLRKHLVQFTRPGIDWMQVLASQASERYRVDVPRAKASLREKVQALSGVAPSVIDRAGALAAQLEAAGLGAEQVIRSSDGSVMIYFVGREVRAGAHRRYAVFECSEDGAAVLLKDRDTGKADALGIESEDDVARVAARVAEFIA